MEGFVPKLIALDIDGTLLNSARELTQETCEAIAQARAKGILVVPCSGRHFSGTRGVARLAGMGDAVICGNGALVTTWDGEVIFRKTLGLQRCLELIRFARAYGLGGNLYADDVLYAQSPNSVTRYYERLNAQLPRQAQCICELAPELETVAKAHAEGILKFEIFPLPPEPRQALQELLKSWGDVAAEGNLRTSVELHADGVSKGTGLMKAADYYGISMENVLAVGDAENDVPMLRLAGLGAAMGSGVEAARCAADWVIPGCDENGAAWMIRKVLE